MNHVQVDLIEYLPRRLAIRRAIKASDYFSYSEEVGCDIWDQLKEIAAPDEPICLWLSQNHRSPGTSEYVQGAVVAGEQDLPEGFEVIDLPATTYLRFQGTPFKEEDYGQAIAELHAFLHAFDPAAMGYAWDKDAPRIQLEPLGERGYIELWPVKKK